MKTATSLTLVAIGAITAFAITAHIAFLNLHVTGWVLILTGVAGAIITRTRLRRIRPPATAPAPLRPASPASAAATAPRGPHAARAGP